MSETWAPHHRATEYEEIMDLLQPPAWHAQAKCRGMDAKLFFPGQGEFMEHRDRGGGYTRSPVRAICESCPVQEECLEAGLHERFGIWGGLTERERKRLRRARRRQAS